MQIHYRCIYVTMKSCWISAGTLNEPMNINSLAPLWKPTAVSILEDQK
jgi:hypothetical protein